MLYEPAPLLSPWTAIVGFILGALAGSFLNMLIWRLPREKSLIDPPHSICPNCDHRLTALDLIPILSWLRTGGKCRHCGAPIASRYLWVEVLVGTLFAIVWVQKMTVGLDPDWGGFFAYAAFAAILVAIIFIDGELYIIPDELNAALLFVGILYNGLHGRLHEAIVGAFVGWAVIWGIAFLGRLAFGKDAMGQGDVKMMRGVGAFLGATLLGASVGLAVVLGLVGGISQQVLAARRAKAHGTPEIVADAETEAPEAPSSKVYEVLMEGMVFLLCLDVVALFVRPLGAWLYGLYSEETRRQDENWNPEAIEQMEGPMFRPIPFGPYLAAGALVCMLAGGPIERGMKAYWDNATGASSGEAVQGAPARP